jgi:hypothetical protein
VRGSTLSTIRPFFVFGLLVLALCAPAAAGASESDVFGEDGVVQLQGAGAIGDLVAYEDGPHAGKFLLAVNTPWSESYFARLMPDGSRDLSFGDGEGFAPAGGFPVSSLALDNEDRIVTGEGQGYTSAPTAVRRYLPDGLPDTAFGQAGSFEIAGVSRPNCYDRPRVDDVEPLQDGRILAVGTTSTTCCVRSGSAQLRVAITPDGQVDQSYNAEMPDPESSTCNASSLTAVSELPSGEVVTIGHTVCGSHPAIAQRMRVRRYSANGDLVQDYEVADFAEATQLAPCFPEPLNVPAPVELQAFDNGDALALGRGTADTGLGFAALARFNAQGELASDFSVDGKQALTFTESTRLDDIAAIGGGRSVAVGKAGGTSFVLAIDLDGDVYDITPIEAPAADQFNPSSIVVSGSRVIAGGTVPWLGRSAPTLVEISLGTAPEQPPSTWIDFNPGFDDRAVLQSDAFRFSSSDVHATIECAVDGRPWRTCGDTFQIAGLREGSHEIEVRAVTPTGIPDPSPELRRFWVGEADVTPPETNILAGPEDGSVITEPTATLEFASDDWLADFECSLDEGPYEGCASPEAFSELPEGPHTLAVRAVDPSGNADPTAASRTFTVDLEDEPDPGPDPDPGEPPAEGPPIGEPEFTFDVVAERLRKRAAGILRQGVVSAVVCNLDCEVELELIAGGRQARRLGVAGVVGRGHTELPGGVVGVVASGIHAKVAKRIGGTPLKRGFRIKTRFSAEPTS